MFIILSQYLEIYIFLGINCVGIKFLNIPNSILSTNWVCLIYNKIKFRINNYIQLINWTFFCVLDLYNRTLGHRLETIRLMLYLRIYVRLEVLVNFCYRLRWVWLSCFVASEIYTLYKERLKIWHRLWWTMWTMRIVSWRMTGWLAEPTLPSND